MFRGKSSTPPPMFIVKVLTADYLIEGRISANMSWHSPVVLDVEAAQVQPTGNFMLPVTSTPLLHIQQNAMTAIIPNDEASVVDLGKGFSNEHPFAVTILLDHYRFCGTAFSSSNSMKTLTFSDAILMRDVQIDCLTAGAQLGDLKAAYALIYNRKMLQAVFAM